MSKKIHIPNESRNMRLIIAITGATGVIFGIHLLEVLRGVANIETHLILSKWARLNIVSETNFTVAQVEELADYVYEEGNLGACLSSGSFFVDAMVVAPCSMRTLAAIRHGMADNLIIRAADVTLKENRPLLLVPRETPLNQIHLENMLELVRMGVCIAPPMPAFYTRPHSLGDMVHHITIRVLDQLGITLDYDYRWQGITAAKRRGNPTFYQSEPEAVRQQLTIMWEATAHDQLNLRNWVRCTLGKAIIDHDPQAIIDSYYNDEGRVVLIATGEFDQISLPEPPSEILSGTPHRWYFRQDDYISDARETFG